MKMFDLDQFQKSISVTFYFDNDKSNKLPGNIHNGIIAGKLKGAMPAVTPEKQNKFRRMN